MRRCEAFAQYWATSMTGARCEARLNTLPQFVTEIDGLDIHFIHVRSKHENALPMIVTHGWPGSIIEQMKLIGPLPINHPRRDRGGCLSSRDFVSAGDTASQANRRSQDWDPVTIAKAWLTLTNASATVIRGAGWRLGQRHFGGHGFAAATGIARHSHQHGGDGSARCFEGAFHGRPPPAGLSPTKSTCGISSMTSYSKNGLGYLNEMALRPQTLQRARRFAGRSCGLHTRPRHCSYQMIVAFST